MYCREAGPLCVSPTGQFIAPSTCPGTILVDFLSCHMNEAAEKSEAYKKYVSQPRLTDTFVCPFEIA